MPVKLTRMQAELSARACRAMLHKVRNYANAGSLTPDLQRAHGKEIADLERLIAVYEAHAKATPPQT